MNDQNNIVELFEKALNHHGGGRVTDALSLYDEIIQLNPNVALVHSNRGVALASLRRFDEAILAHDRAIELDPNHAESYNNRGTTFQALDSHANALADFDRAIRLSPELAYAHFNRATVLRQLGQFHEALDSYDRTIALNRTFAEAHNNKGVVLRELSRPHEALQSWDDAIALQPDYADAYYNKGNALKDLNRLDEALLNYNQAISLSPQFSEAHNNKGSVLREMKRLDEAIECFDRAIEIGRDPSEPSTNKAHCLLLTKQFAQGWQLYEWRKRRAVPSGAATHAEPIWLGEEDLAGKRLFVHAEQGLGDTIQFCRYIPVVEALGAKVVFSPQDALARLMTSLSPTVQLANSAEMPCDFDYHIPLLSMPLAFKTNRNSIPARVPYLHPEAARVHKWQFRIGDAGFKIGICWQGSKRGTVDIGRSFPVAHFQRLSHLPGVRLISLQKGDGSEQLAGLPAHMTVETLGDDFDAGPDAFIDTAAVMENLDLVITSDTAVAHLSGALGRPTWLALKYVPDWRWFLDEAGSPWYPTMDLFRQSSRGDWDSVFGAMEAQLFDLMPSRLSGPSEPRPAR